jgi:hypothetical protein
MHNTVTSYVEHYGSDKVRSGYAYYYDILFGQLQQQTTSILEIGIGTQQPEIPSTFAGNAAIFPQYKPGGSLRVWRDFFPNAQVYGIDVAEDCRINDEPRITTHIFSSLDPMQSDRTFGDKTLDIIIDDGLHTAIGQLATMYNFFKKVKDGGLYIIEDCGGHDGTNIYDEFEKNFRAIADEHEFFFGGNFIAIRKTYSKIGRIPGFKEFADLAKPPMKVTPNLTVVTGLWNINRANRDFSHYIENFKKFLEIPVNMFIYVPQELEHLVWQIRHKDNTIVKVLELDGLKENLYAPFWDKTQEIRTNPSWLNQTGEGGWLTHSPQAVNEWYNPIVQSKMFMLHDVKVTNPFNTDYFLWLDAGITNTVYEKYFTDERCFDNIIPLLKSFLFLSYPYETNSEIHGFDYGAMKKYARQDVRYVCRGGLFGGHKDFLSQANSTYYALLQNTLNEGYMGTEESIFSIMAHLEPHVYRRYALDGNGLVVKFIQALLDNTAQLESVPHSHKSSPIVRGVYNAQTDKTSLYVLSFNFPEQFNQLVQSMEGHKGWLDNSRKILINNSQDQGVLAEYDVLCERYGFEHLKMGENLGINRGRLFAAQHFQESNSDYYFFFEDDMFLHAPNAPGYCRNGFRRYVPNLYTTAHKIMAREQLDFLKLSYTEVYMDNNIQVSWYNVPQHIRTELWPDYDRLPVSGLDPNAPRTKFSTIEVQDGVSYIKGDIYYANWPMIVNKAGNYKMFLETTWEYPYEQTWMSHMFQKTIEGELNPGVLLASPINHNRLHHYTAEERREN